MSTAPRTPAEMKKALRDAGFEIYRTRGDVVHLAERVRENLLMDAGVFVNGAASSVGFIVRAERAAFPGESEAQLLERARRLAGEAASRGYKEIGTHTREVHDPGDSARTLDVWYEVSFETSVLDPATLMDEIRFAMSIEKAALPR